MAPTVLTGSEDLWQGKRESEKISLGKQVEICKEKRFNEIYEYVSEKTHVCLLHTTQKPGQSVTSCKAGKQDLNTQVLHNAKCRCTSVSASYYLAKVFTLLKYFPFILHGQMQNWLIVDRPSKSNALSHGRKCFNFFICTNLKKCDTLIPLKEISLQPDAYRSHL